MKNLRTILLMSTLFTLQKPVVAKDHKPTYVPLDVADVVRTIADYDIYKMTVPPTGDGFGGWSMYYGVTDMSNRNMGLNAMLTPDFMHLTILHEMRHTLNDRLGLSNKEEWVREYACKDYELFFKKKCFNQNDLEKAIKSEYK